MRYKCKVYPEVKLLTGQEAWSVPLDLAPYPVPMLDNQTASDVSEFLFRLTAGLQTMHNDVMGFTGLPQLRIATLQYLIEY